MSDPGCRQSDHGRWTSVGMCTHHAIREKRFGGLSTSRLVNNSYSIIHHDNQNHASVRRPNVFFNDREILVWPWFITNYRWRITKFQAEGNSRANMNAELKVINAVYLKPHISAVTTQKMATCGISLQCYGIKGSSHGKNHLLMNRV